MSGEQLESEFADYEMIHRFMHPNEALKGWVNSKTFKNHYNVSWDVLMPVLKQIDELNYELPEDSNLIGDINYGLLNIDMANTYYSVIEFIKWYNEQEK